MDANFGWIGLAASLALAAIGSAIGIGTAGQAAIGAWKKEYASNKRATAFLVVFVAAPFSQLIYGFVLMLMMQPKIIEGTIDPWQAVAAGVFGGLAMGFSAVFQGKAGAAAADALAETGKGVGNYIQVIGVVEGVALLVMVFMLIFGI